MDGAVWAMTEEEGGIPPYPGMPYGHGVDAGSDDGDADSDGGVADGSRTVVAWLSGQGWANGAGAVRATYRPVVVEDGACHIWSGAVGSGAGCDGE